MVLAECAAGFALAASGLHVGTNAIAAVRCRRRRQPLPAPAGAPPVTIVRPICGVDNFARETLGSSFGLDYPDYDVIFCAARADDPAVGLVRELIAAHPEQPATLLIGDERAGPNPKLNNVVKGFDAATTPWVIMADSNVMMPRDYLQRLLARWRANSGCVVSVPIAARPANFWAELECAFLNTHEARWEYASDTFGLGFAQGKNMLFRRDLLEAAGGIRALGREVAEDAATTKLMRRMGRRIHLMDAPFEQPLGARRLIDVWQRQTRWARLRRITFPRLFAPEILTGSLFPLLAALYAASALGANVAVVTLLLLGVWIGAEAVMARCAGWHFSWRMPAALLLRDLMLPMMCLDAWLHSEVTWRGSTVREARAPTRLRELSELPAYAYAKRLTCRYRERWLNR
jgi:ceramide glucosyltransferase